MKKNSILIGIIVVMFLAAGIVLYKGFFAGSSTSSQPADPAIAAIATNGEKILPNGTSLDFSLVKKFNGGTKFFNYPVVLPSEVNVPLQDLVK